MDRVRNYISFITWFVGLSYLALWPLAVPCAGLTMESWRDTCQSHSALVLSPGLHVIGAAAAGWVVLRLGLFGLRRLLRTVSPKAERGGAWRQALAASLKQNRKPLPPPRWVPRRREFGLRRGSR